jgi:RNA recognition motif-containing protein
MKKRVEAFFKINDNNSIFIQNINYKTSELDLGKHFERFGNIL